MMCDNRYMAARKRLSERQVKINSVLPPLFRRKFTPKMLIFIAGLIIFSVLITRFFDGLSLQNQLGQAEQYYGQLHDQTLQQQRDLKHLIDISGTQINCLQLESTVAQKVCDAHNKNTPL